MIYTKEYLQSIPELEKREAIDNAVKSIAQLVLISAKANNNFTYSLSRHPLFSTEELIVGLRHKFPDCHLQYYKTNHGAEQIYIDWS